MRFSRERHCARWDFARVDTLASTFLELYIHISPLWKTEERLKLHENLKKSDGDRLLARAMARSAAEVQILKDE